MQVPTMMRQQPVASELKPLEVNLVWPANMKPFNSKWVFRLKEDGNSKLICHKVHLVEKCFLQKQGQDYEGISTYQNQDYRIVDNICETWPSLLIFLRFRLM